MSSFLFWALIVLAVIVVSGIVSVVVVVCALALLGDRMFRQQCVSCGECGSFAVMDGEQVCTACWGREL